MRRTIISFSLLAATSAALFAAPNVVVSSDRPVFAEHVTAWLTDRGLHAKNADISAVTLAGSDVLVLHRAEAAALAADEREALTGFAKTGGGIIALDAAIAAGDPEWLVPLIGGANTPDTKSFSSTMMLYLATDQHPITRGASSFDVQDRTVYDCARHENIQVLASAFTPKLSDRPDDTRQPQDPNRANVYDIQPQIWAFEHTLEGGEPHRAVVILQGAEETLTHSTIGAFVLRGIAWAAGEEEVDAFVPESTAHQLRYPVGGPRTGEDTVAQLAVEPGFEVSVVATEPLVNKPIAIQWDAAGRMWVAESPEYPNGRRERVAPPWRETGVLDPYQFDRPAEDRISILSAPDENGKFTKKTIFYEGLELVTGFCLYRDGVIAVHQPDIVWIRDTDGDGKADKVERIFTGFAPGDTHFVANHFIAAPDGWIYASMGGGADARRPETSDRVTRIGAGVFRFRPDGSAIEQVSSKGGNGFGLDITSDGEIFFNQATTGNPVQHVALPESTLARGRTGRIGGAQSVIEQRKIAGYKPVDRASLRQIDVVGGYSAACSSLVYEGGAWPEHWANSLFCTEPLVNIVHREVLVPEGATYTGVMENTRAEFIHSPDDYWFRPIDVALGPDGALYLLDFYNPVVAHNDTRGPLHSRSGASVRPDREHYFGRIYRVQHQDAKSLEVPDLNAAKLPGRVEALAHPNRVVRFNALNLLVEQDGDDVISALRTVVANSDSAHARILALWGLQRLGGLEPVMLVTALKDAEAAVRKSAALVAEAAAANAAQAALAEGIADHDPRVRIAMLRGLARTGLDEASAKAIVAVYPSLNDDLTKSAAAAAAAADRPAVLRAALASTEPAGVAELVASIADALVESRDGDAFAGLLAFLASQPNADDSLKILLLEKAARLVEPPAAEVSDETFQSLLASANPQVRAAALPVVVAWSRSEALKPVVAELVGELLDQLKQPDRGPEQRMLLIDSLIGAHTVHPDILATIGSLLGDAAVPVQVRRTALNALRRSDAPVVGPILVAAFDQLETELQVAAFDSLLSRAEWVNHFLEAAEKKEIHLTKLGPTDISRLRNHQSAPIAKRANALLDEIRKPNPDKEALIASLLPIVRQPGDLERGKELFGQACAICHRMNGVGVEAGPALDGIGAHGYAQLLVSIVDPNRQIDAGYELFNIETDDGNFHSGMIARENEARIVIRSVAGETEVPVNRVKSRINTHRSLMPEGLEGLGAEALRDIIAYLCGDNSRYQVVDLTNSFTADARRGLYQSQDARHDSIQFAKYGMVEVEGIPFKIVDAASNGFNGNVISLRGGGRGSFSSTLPNRVEIPVGQEAKAFHFLGGIAGWGAGGPNPNGAPIVKLTFVFADGSSEEKVLRNGLEFADHIARIDVPGSKFAEGVVTSTQQMRWFTVNLTKPGMVEKILMEGYNQRGRGGPSPTTVAITAERP
jgi:putative membrane-bound dehydrogenase-like protein